MKKRFLFILNEFPIPRNTSGVTLIDYEILSRTPGEYEIDILVLDEEVNDSLLTEMKIIFPLVKNISFHQVSRRKNSLNILSRSFFNFTLFSNLSLLKKVNASLYDAVYLSPMLSRVDVATIDSPILLNAVDSFSKFNYREFKNTKKIRSYLKFITYKFYERYLLKNVSLFNVVSSDDALFMKKVHRKNKHIEEIININIGVDTKQFSKSKRGHNVKDNKFKLLFVGNFDYQPNADAARFLCNDIFPRLSAIDPDFEIFIVGKNPPDDLIHSESVIKTGFVDDVMDYYSSCSVFVCPLRFGAGMKNKVLEAMSCGLPIVSSDVGVEGIVGLEDDVNFILANNVDSFVNALVKLKNDQIFSDQLGNAAMGLVSSVYDWPKIAERYYRALEEISRGK